MEEIDDIDIEKYKQNYIAVCGETLPEGKRKDCSLVIGKIHM